MLIAVSNQRKTAFIFIRHLKNGFFDGSFEKE